MVHRMADRALNGGRRFRSIGLTSIVALLAVVARGCAQAPPSEPRLPDSQAWHEFEGTWTAAGNRHIMHMGGDRQSSIANLDGSLMLAGPAKPAIGFRAEAIVLNDSASGMVGRAVWTDEHGDQAYSELHGEGTATKNKIVGTFLEGTGRYTGAMGS